MIIAVIPAYNEGKKIEEVVKATKQYVNKVIVVDDGSADNTASAARKAGATVLQHMSNKGKAGSLKTGVTFAKKFKPDILVMLDGDGQHDPNDIPKLLAPIQSGDAEIVYGYRSMLKKHPLSSIPGMLADLVFGGKDVLCGFKAMKFWVWDTLEITGGEGYLIELILHEHVLKHKIKHVFVPIRTIGKTRISWINGLKLFFKFISRKKKK